MHMHKKRNFGGDKKKRRVNKLNGVEAFDDGSN